MIVSMNLLCETASLAAKDLCGKAKTMSTDDLCCAAIPITAENPRGAKNANTKIASLNACVTKHVP
jgi:hypothetical protein